MKVLVSDKLGKSGLEVLEKEPDLEVKVKTGLTPEELAREIKGYDGLIIRSGTRVTAEVLEAADKLKVIGRAGVGVDNIDVEAATRKGIIVMNTPGGNATSTAEHAISLILSLSRNIARADASMRNKEWNRSKFLGVEICGKTLGIVGLGQVGGEVARLAAGLGMNILGYDPYISPQRATRLKVKLCELEELIEKADYITLHTPLTEETRHLIDKKRLSQMKSGVRIVNCARGGIIEEEALYQALKEGRVAGAALDVYEKEPPEDSPLLELDNCLLTPHLGAATEEAQAKVARAVAQQMVDALKRRMISNAVNAPSIDPEVLAEIQPYLTLAERLGQLQVQLVRGHLMKVEVKYSGQVINYESSLITVALTKGLLEPIMEEGVNYVNAPILARERDIRVIETKSDEIEDFSSMITVKVETDKETSSLAGTLFSKDDLRIVRINGYHVDAVPAGYMLIITNQDKPGLIGEVGIILGKAKINIAGMTCGRKKKGEQAVTVLNLDDAVPAPVMERIRNLPQVLSCQLVKL